MTRPSLPNVLIAGAILGVLGIVVHVASTAIRALAEERLEVATLRSRISADSLELDRLRHVAVTHDTAYVTDTTRYRTLERRYQTLLAQWTTAHQPEKPTSNPHDSVGKLPVGRESDTIVPVPPLPVDPAHVIAVADSTIRACAVAVASCEQRVADRDAIIARQASQLTANAQLATHWQHDAFRARHWMFGLPKPSPLLALGAGLLAGALLSR